MKKTSPKYSNRLFENDGKGHFTDVTAKAGLAGTGFDNGVAIGDYDNDGREDIFVGGVHANHLYHNDGGAFIDVTAKAGLDGNGPAVRPSVVGGGRVGGCQQRWPAGPLCRELPGMGSGCGAHPARRRRANSIIATRSSISRPPTSYFSTTATELSATFRRNRESAPIPEKEWGSALADYDLDGLMDFFVPNDKMHNFLFHNKGGVRFEEIAFKAGVALTEDGKFISGMGVDFRDVDNDGSARYRFRGARQ